MYDVALQRVRASGSERKNVLRALRQNEKKKLKTHHSHHLFCRALLTTGAPPSLRTGVARCPVSQALWQCHLSRLCVPNGLAFHKKSILCCQNLTCHMLLCCGRAVDLKNARTQQGGSTLKSLCGWCAVNSCNGSACLAAQHAQNAKRQKRLCGTPVSLLFFGGCFSFFAHYFFSSSLGEIKLATKESPAMN